MAERFPLYTDADVHQPLIKALRERGWDIVRAIDTYPEGTEDEVHFEHAAKENRVLVTNAASKQWPTAGSKRGGPSAASSSGPKATISG